MDKWLVIIDFDSPISMNEVVAIQAALGEDQIGIGHSECGVSVIVCADQRPEIPPLQANSSRMPPNILVARLPADTWISGRPALVDWWSQQREPRAPAIDGSDAPRPPPAGA